MKEYKRDKRVLIPRDEFEEEAGEGLGRLSRDEAEADLLELKARMARRVARPRAIWLPAAAAVVILLVASALLVTMLRDRRVPGSDTVLAEAAVKDTVYIAMAEPLEKQDSEAPAPVTAGSAAMQTKEARYSPLAEIIDNEIAGVTVADEVIVTDEQKADDDVVYVVSAVVQEEMGEEVVVQALPQIITTGMGIRSKTAERETVPAAGSRKDKATVEAAAKKEAATVDAVAEGRKDAVAVEEPTGAAAIPGIAVPEGSASPEGGWIKYRAWVAENIRYPEGITPVVRQEVMVSFMVQPDGTLADLKAVRTPGELFTKEVFRLLREGPKWVPASQEDNVMAAEVVVVFVLK